jgi:putative peptide zinc metalloprotease protein
VITLWVLIVIPLLLFQLTLIAVHMPRIVATAGDSLQHQWHTASDAFGHGEPLTAIVGIVQMIVLLLPLVGIAVMFVRLARRAGRAVWRWSDGSVVRRSLVTAVGLATLILLAYVWWPNGEYQPIQPGERGTVQELTRSVSDLGGGRPALTPEREVELGGTPGIDDPRPPVTPAPEAPAPGGDDGADAPAPGDDGADTPAPASTTAPAGDGATPTTTADPPPSSTSPPATEPPPTTLP